MASEAPPVEVHDKAYWRSIKPHKQVDDPVWHQVDEYNIKHLHQPGSVPDPALMEKILKSSEENGLPPIAVSPTQGKFLQLQARIAKARTIVEVGMLGGYSTVWLARSHPDAKITSIEIDQEFAQVSKKHFELAGVANQIEVRVGSGLDELPKLVQEVKDGKRPKIDFAFIDANKLNNLDYFKLCMDMAHPGTVIVVDNVVRGGRVIDDAWANDENIKGTRRVIEGVGKDDRVDATILQTVSDKSYDGFLTAVVK